MLSLLRPNISFFTPQRKFRSISNTRFVCAIAIGCRSESPTKRCEFCHPSTFRIGKNWPTTRTPTFTTRTYNSPCSWSRGNSSKIRPWGKTSQATSWSWSTRFTERIWTLRFWASFPVNSTPKITTPSKNPRRKSQSRIRNSLPNKRAIKGWKKIWRKRRPKKISCFCWARNRDSISQFSQKTLFPKIKGEILEM